MKKTIIRCFLLLAFSLSSGPGFAEQQLVYWPEDDGKAPREEVTVDIKAVSQAITDARNDSSLPELLRFNRLHKPKPEPQLHQTDDGLHDASLSSVQNELLPPKAGMAGLSPDKYGNMVNWVTALENGEIKPVTKISEDADDQEVVDHEIVIPAVGWTQDVVFPHKAHTIWLACSNCHEAQTFDTPFFEPAAGENPITMAEIVEGKWCGWCHSTPKIEKVAFPISNCARCHVGPKKTEPTPIKAYMLRE